MTANKNLFTQIEDVLVRNNANVSVNLINIAQIFAQLDQRFAAMEGKLERLLAEPSAGKIGAGIDPNSSARAEQLITLLDQRIKAALEREQRALCEATGDVARGVLREFVDEFKRELELKLKQVETLLATRPPLDPPPRPN